MEIRQIKYDLTGKCFEFIIFANSIVWYLVHYCHTVIDSCKQPCAVKVSVSEKIKSLIIKVSPVCKSK